MLAEREFEIYTLPNGIRLVHKETTRANVAHCGFVLDIGSRDEQLGEEGIAHFWEHMAFKGTKRRKAYHIINRLESVGGELNAFTTKEKITFYASVLTAHFEKAFELLSDITFQTSFPEKEIEKEKGVILEEMSMYLDSPEDSILDEFDQIVFEGHPLGVNILGTKDSIPIFSREDFIKFRDRNLDTTRIVFTSVGNIPFGKVKQLADKYLSPIPLKSAAKNRKPFLNYQSKMVEKGRSSNLVHCIIGRDAFPLQHANRIPFFMLINILGGPGMNSRLNLSLREKHGLVYTIEANYTPFTDTGMLSVYFSTDKRNLKRVVELAQKEFQLIKEKPLGTVQLHQAKHQLMGQLAIAEESNSSLMLMMGRSLLDLGRIESLESIFSKIESVSATDLQDLAIEYFDVDKISTLTYKPE